MFLAHLAPEARAQLESFSDLEALLQRSLAEAHAVWPLIPMDTGSFLAYWAQHTTASPTLASDLNTIRVSDLYLAWACVQGCPQAIADLEKHYLPEINLSLSQLHCSSDQIAEVKQQLRADLWLGRSPALANYGGRGRLRRFIRVLAVRAAHHLASRKQPLLLEQEQLAAFPSAEEDPELQILKNTYRDAFSAAFEIAVKELSSDDRLLLKQHIVDDLKIDQLAALYHLHRATMARRLVRARETLALATRAHFLAKVPLGQQSLNSVLRLIRSQIEVSLSRFL